MTTEQLLITSYLTVNIVGIIFLSILLVYLTTTYRSRVITHKIFVVLISTVIAVLLFDSAMWIIDKQVFPGSVYLNYFVTCSYYILNPAIGLVWVCYVDYFIYKNGKKILTRLPFYAIPFLASAIVSITSIWTGWFYTIDHVTNEYSRNTNYFFIMAICAYIYYLYAFVKILICWKKINKRNRIPLILFMFFPLFASVIQTILYGVSVIWISTALAITVLFISMQSQPVLKDYLTGLYNRWELETYMEGIFSKVKHKTIYGVMIDIMKFKSINDTYGHVVGDDALKDASNILQKSISKKDFLSRYGGDEFVIIIESNDIEYCHHILENIQLNSDSFNKLNAVPYKINFSIGIIEIPSNQKIDIREFITIVDKKMYEDKKNRN